MSSSASFSSSSATAAAILPLPTGNDFDQDTARALLKQTATLVVDHFPIGSEFGIDLSIHYTGDRFMGIKLIPPGLHFVYFSLVRRGEHAQVAPRSGFYYYFRAGECLVTRWDAAAEDIVLEREDAGVDQAERLKLAVGQGHLDRQLGAYQYDQYQTWVSLTDYISEELYKRLNPTCGRIFSASSLVYAPNADGSAGPARLDASGLPEMIVAPETAIRFLSMPTKRFLVPEGATPKEITAHMIDSTYTLETMLSSAASYGAQPPESTLLGELQFAFIAFLLGHVFEAFEHWRDLLRILCSARAALSSRPDLFLAFIRVLHFQLKQTNEAIFADIVENENQVFAFLRTFMLNLRTASDAGVSLELRRRGEGFASSLKKMFKWELDEEPDDELPTIVMPE